MATTPTTPSVFVSLTLALDQLDVRYDPLVPRVRLQGWLGPERVTVDVICQAGVLARKLERLDPALQKASA